MPYGNHDHDQNQIIFGSIKQLVSPTQPSIANDLKISLDMPWIIFLI
jgi:hypothetical protein